MFEGIRAATPFIDSFRVSHVRYAHGLPRAYLAPGGAFGKVLVGSLVTDDTPVAVKLLLGSGTSRNDFNEEVQLLQHLRGVVDTLRARPSGTTLTLSERGASHVIHIYGTGKEPNLSHVHADLLREAAFVIAMEAHVQTVSQAFLRPGASPAPLNALLRATHEIALGLAFTAEHRVIVRGYKLWFYCRR